MSYMEDLASILEGVMQASFQEVHTLHDGLKVYMVDYVRRGASMNTISNNYVEILRFADDVATSDNNGEPFPLAKLNRQVIEAHLARFAAGKELRSTKVPSSHTVDRRRRVMKAFIRWMVSEEYLGNDPTKKLSSIRLRERFPSVWSLEDVKRFLSTFDTSTLTGHRNYLIALLALNSGLRAGELTMLRPMDIHLNTMTMSVSDKGKTGARTAVITADVLRELTKWMRRRSRELGMPDSAPLFPAIGFNGERLSTEPLRSYVIGKVIRKHAQQAGISGVKLGAHSLRHTAATHLARGGASAFEIQRFLGHASINMSMRYVAMSNEAVQRKVQEVGILSQLSQEPDEKTAILQRIRNSR